MRMSDRFRKDFPEETIELCADVYVLKVGNHYVREGRLFDELKEADHYDCIGPMTGRDSLRMATDASELVPGSRVVKVRKVRRSLSVGDRVAWSTRTSSVPGSVEGISESGYSALVRFRKGNAFWLPVSMLKRLRPKASP